MSTPAAPTPQISPQMRWSMFDPDNDHLWEYTYISNDVFGQIDADMPQTFPVTKYGAIGDDLTDDTAAIQATIDAAQAAIDSDGSQSRGGAIIWLPRRKGHYLIKGALTISSKGRSYIKFVGAGASYLRGTSDSTDPVLTIKRNGSNPIPGNIVLENVTISGANYWDGADTIPRIGVKIDQAQGVVFRDVWIGNFSLGGMVCTDMWDSRFYNLSVSRCGKSISNNNYAYAVSFTGSTDQCNGNQFFGGMWQYNPCTLFLDKDSRNNTWTGVKFENRSDENGDSYPADNSTMPTFYFKQGIENGFVNCFFAQDYHNRDQKYVIHADNNTGGYVETAGLLPSLAIVGCQFTTPIGMNAQWLKGFYINAAHNVFNRCDGLSQDFPFWLQTGTKFKDNNISFGNEGRNCFNIDGDNVQITGNTLYQGFDLDTASGAVYNLLSQRIGVIVKDNYLRGNFDNFLLHYGYTQQEDKVWMGQGQWQSPIPKEATWSNPDNSTPSAFMTHFVSVSFADSSTELTYFSNGYSGQRLALRFNHSAVLKHDLDHIWLKGLADRTPASGEVVEFLCTTAGVWMEM
jgi:hypothetical protein